jgi:GT2 family glycosyltransferase
VTALPTVSVVVCTYTEDRFDDLSRAIDSLLGQSLPPAEVVVVVDHNPALLERVRRTWATPRLTAVGNTGPKGLSGARNTGLASAGGEVVAFLDDDAVAAPDWLACLLEPYTAPDVMAVGGKVVAAWDAGRPSYFPAEFDWVVGCSYTGMPIGRVPVRNLIGANMSFRRDVFDAVGGFVSGIGRIGTVPLGCEETELCIRARRQFPGREILYEPAAVVRHRVFPARGRLRYFFSRCAAEGTSKALVAALTGPSAALATERTYVSRGRDGVVVRTRTPPPATRGRCHRSVTPPSRARRPPCRCSTRRSARSTPMNVELAWLEVTQTELPATKRSS